MSELQQALDPVRTSATEKKKSSFFKGIKAIVKAYVCREAVDSSPEVDTAAADDRTLKPGPVPKHYGGPP